MYINPTVQKSDVQDLEVVHKGGVPLRVSFVMTKSDSYKIKNPLSSGKVVSGLDIVDTDGEMFRYF